LRNIFLNTKDVNTKKVKQFNTIRLSGN